MKNYKSPKVEFSSLKLKERVADTCWGNHGEKEDYFYDYSGKGYIQFWITGGSCSFSHNTIKVEYINVPEIEKATAYNEFYNKIVAAGGESGNSWKGVGSIVDPDPDPTWS